MEARRKRLVEQQPQWGDDLSRAINQAAESSHAGTFSCSYACIEDSRKVVKDPPSTKSYMDFKTCKGWNIKTILSKSKNFILVPRISCSSSNLSSCIRRFEEDGKPLIIEGCHKHERWPSDLFNVGWLLKHGGQDITARNVHTRRDQTIPLSEFFQKSRGASPHTTPDETERLYGKDAECPIEWNNWLQQSGVIPNRILPQSNENLLTNLPPKASVETLMCYIGIGDTYTPCHKDACASTGQNLMCYTEKGGSSYWFMTDSASTPDVDEYFRNLGQELDHETQALAVEELAKAPFKIYVAEQKLGDLVLVPPRSCHQVINSGGITIKTSWSRMTLRGLITAYYHELPLYRRVCRPETYKVKSIIHHTLLQQAIELNEINQENDSPQMSPSVVIPSSSRGRGDQIAQDLATLVRVFSVVLSEEDCGDSTKTPHPLCPPSAQPSSLDPQRYELPQGRLICDFCGADIYQTYFQCKKCTPDPLEGSSTTGELVSEFVVCAGCYVEGRSCLCQMMELGQCFSFDDLKKVLYDAKAILTEYTSKIQPSARPLDLEDQPDYGLSRAAYRLQQSRSQQRSRERKCHTSLSHETKPSSVLYCKKCHSSKCYTHLLKDRRLHSIVAIIEHSQDDTGQRFHTTHGESKKKYECADSDLRQAEISGNQPMLRYQLVKLALAHGICQPLNNSVTPGWYDHVQLVSRNPENLAPYKTPMGNAVIASEPSYSSPKADSMPNDYLVASCLGYQSDLSDLTPSPSPPPSCEPDVPKDRAPEGSNPLKRWSLLGVFPPPPKRSRSALPDRIPSPNDKRRGKRDYQRETNSPSTQVASSQMRIAKRSVRTFILPGKQGSSDASDKHEQAHQTAEGFTTRSTINRRTANSPSSSANEKTLPSFKKKPKQRRVASRNHEIAPAQNSLENSLERAINQSSKSSTLESDNRLSVSDNELDVQSSPPPFSKQGSKSQVPIMPPCEDSSAATGNSLSNRSVGLDPQHAALLGQCVSTFIRSSLHVAEQMVTDTFRQFIQNVELNMNTPSTSGAVSSSESRPNSGPSDFSPPSFGYPEGTPGLSRPQYPAPHHLQHYETRPGVFRRPTAFPSWPSHNQYHSGPARSETWRNNLSRGHKEKWTRSRRSYDTPSYTGVIGNGRRKQPHTDTRMSGWASTPRHAMMTEYANDTGIQCLSDSDATRVGEYPETSSRGFSNRHWRSQPSNAPLQQRIETDDGFRRSAPSRMYQRGSRRGRPGNNNYPDAHGTRTSYHDRRRGNSHIGRSHQNEPHPPTEVDECSTSVPGPSTLPSPNRQPPCVDPQDWEANYEQPEDDTTEQSVRPSSNNYAGHHSVYGASPQPPSPDVRLDHGLARHTDDDSITHNPW